LLCLSRCWFQLSKFRSHPLWLQIFGWSAVPFKFGESQYQVWVWRWSSSQKVKEAIALCNTGRYHTSPFTCNLPAV
jgi:hypothetical protein